MTLQMQLARLAKRVQSEADDSSALHRLVEEMITFEPQVKEEGLSQEEIKRRQREAKERRERKQREEEEREGEEDVTIVVSSSDDTSDNTNNSANHSPRKTYPLRSGRSTKHSTNGGARVSFADEKERERDEECLAMKRRRLEIEERRLALEEKRTEILEREIALREKETETRQKEYQVMLGVLRYFSAVEKGLN